MNRRHRRFLGDLLPLRSVPSISPAECRRVSAVLTVDGLAPVTSLNFWTVTSASVGIAERTLQAVGPRPCSDHRNGLELSGDVDEQTTYLSACWVCPEWRSLRIEPLPLRRLSDRATVPREMPVAATICLTETVIADPNGAWACRYPRTIWSFADTSIRIGFAESAGLRHFHLVAREPGTDFRKAVPD